KEKQLKPSVEPITIVAFTHTQVTFFTSPSYNNDEVKNMFISIIKDSIILFLLLYALVSLADQFVRFLSLHLIPQKTQPQGFYLLDLAGIPSESLEQTLRTFISEKKDRILLITDENNEERTDIIELLCKEFKYVTPLSRKELAMFFTTQTALDTSVKTKQEEDPSPYI
ncbi:MAG: hypothetical protein IKL80_03390, partial [Clostridia bacterium]|nr:hypothetical protein [Clostridia bacterium]